MTHNLELRVKLWNHLATKGNLVLSAAWYETDEQAKFWHEMTATSAKQSGTNDHKEIELLRALTKRPEFSSYANDDLIIIDLGCGTGIKAAEFLDALPPSRIIYVPVDNSQAFIEQTWGSIFGKGLIDENTLHTGLRTEHLKDLSEYAKGVASADYERAFGYTLKYFKGFLYLFKNKDNIEFAPVYESHPKLKGLLDRGKAKLTKEWNTFRGKVEELSSGKYSREEARKEAEKLHLAFNPEVMAEIAEEFTAGAYDIMSYLFLTDQEPREKTSLLDEISTKIPPIIRTLETFERQSFSGIASMRRSKSLQHNVKYVHAFGAGINTDFIAGNLEELSSVISETRQVRPWSRRIITLFGQTLGNFSVDERDALIRQISHTMNKGDSLLIGVELTPEKTGPLYEQKVANLRYRYGGKITEVDARELGLPNTQDQTADQFLRHTTRLLGIPDQDIEFDAAYDNNTIRMHYRVTNRNGIRINHPSEDISLTLPFAKEINTAASYKFSIAELDRLISRHGLRIIELPDRDGYTVLFAQKQAGNEQKRMLPKTPTFL